jgi:hypothetical protein
LKNNPTGTGPGANRNMKKPKPEEIISELKKTVTEEFFKANPLKRFPEDFLSRRVKTEFEGILVPRGKLKLKFEKKVQICFESGMVLLEFDTLERAKYILYARKKDHYVYKVPKSEIVVKRAVEKYEKYREEIRDKLIKAFLSRGAERDTAEGLTRQEFEEIGLPYIAGE